MTTYEASGFLVLSLIRLFATYVMSSSNEHPVMNGRENNRVCRTVGVSERAREQAGNMRRPASGAGRLRSRRGGSGDLSMAGRHRVYDSDANALM